MKNFKTLILISLFLLLSSFSFSQENNNLIFQRKTAREFSSQKLTEAQKEKLVEAAMSSPTGGNQRAWEFILIDNSEVLKKMKEGNPYSSALDTTPFVIVIAENINNARYKELLEFDTGIAVQSILLQAGELGLSTVAMSIFPQEKRVAGVRSALQLPDYIVPHMMIAIGYPAYDGAASASVNYKNNAKIHYNKF